MKERIKIKKTEGAEESVELLAASIVKVSEASQRVLDAGLNEKALIVLLRAAIGQGNITNKQIKLVLYSLPRLKAWYCKPGLLQPKQ